MAVTPTGATAEYVVIDRTYELSVWTSRHVEKFARSHRFTLGQRLEGQLASLLETLIRARYDRAGRAGLLREANLLLELLRFGFRQSHDLRCLPANSHEYAAKLVDEIGRMVGGWGKIHATRGAPVGTTGELGEPFGIGSQGSSRQA